MPTVATARRPDWLERALFIGGLLVFLAFASMWLLSLVAPENFRLGSDSWIFPTWAAIALGLSMALKRIPSKIVYFAALLWAVAGLALLALVIFGTRMSAG